MERAAARATANCIADDECAHVMLCCVSTGDLGNISAVDGKAATFELVDTQLTLSGATSVVGRSVVVHADEDDLGRGGHADSKTTGHAGARLYAACCTAIAGTPPHARALSAHRSLSPSPVLLWCAQCLRRHRFGQSRRAARIAAVLPISSEIICDCPNVKRMRMNVRMAADLTAAEQLSAYRRVALHPPVHHAPY
jgi:hypothetical protein